MVSVIMEHYLEKWRLNYPLLSIKPNGLSPPIVMPQPVVWPLPDVSVPLLIAEEVAEFKKLLERAREYDKKNNQPDHGLDEKRQQLRELAKQLGIEIAFV